VTPGVGMDEFYTLRMLASPALRWCYSHGRSSCRGKVIPPQTCTAGMTVHAATMGLLAAAERDGVATESVHCVPYLSLLLIPALLASWLRGSDHGLSSCRPGFEPHHRLVRFLYFLQHYHCSIISVYMLCSVRNTNNIFVHSHLACSCS
jgi:hypothetical protein